MINLLLNTLSPCLLFTICLLIAGCAGNKTPSPDHPALHDQIPSPLLTRETRQVIGTSVEGRDIIAYHLGQGPDIVMIIASIHGNEAVGTPLLHHLRAHLKSNPHLLAGRTIIIVPEANPDGVAKNTRFNVRGIDLNRNYPADNRVDSKRFGNAISEPETKALYQLIQNNRPNRVVSIHQPFGIIDYDGPGKELATQMAKAANLPVKKLGARPGSMGAYVGETLNIPIITVEFKRSDSKRDPLEFWNAYRNMLLVSILWPDSLQHTPQTSQE